MLAGLLVHGLRDEFTAIADLDRFGKPTCHTKLLKGMYHILSLQVLPDIDRQTFAGVVIHDGQCPQPAP